MLNGVKSKDEVLKEFMVKWDKNGDETVTMDEFVEYFKDVSFNIDRVDYFELMMKNAWKI